MYDNILHNYLCNVRNIGESLTNRALFLSGGRITVKSYGMTMFNESEHLGFFKFVTRKQEGS